MVTEVVVIEVAFKPVGTEHVVVVPEPQPLEVSIAALAPPVANKDCILVFCPEVNMFIQASSV